MHFSIYLSPNRTPRVKASWRGSHPTPPAAPLLVGMESLLCARPSPLLCVCVWGGVGMHVSLTSPGADEVIPTLNLRKPKLKGCVAERGARTPPLGLQCGH